MHVMKENDGLPATTAGEEKIQLTLPIQFLFYGNII